MALAVVVPNVLRCMAVYGVPYFLGASLIAQPVCHGVPEFMGDVRNRR